MIIFLKHIQLQTGLIMDGIGKKVSEGDMLSASVLEVEKNDSVYWAFGTMEQADTYFKTLK